MLKSSIHEIRLTRIFEHWLRWPNKEACQLSQYIILEKYGHALLSKGALHNIVFNLKLKMFFYVLAFWARQLHFGGLKRQFYRFKEQVFENNTVLVSV